MRYGIWRRSGDLFASLLRIWSNLARFFWVGCKGTGAGCTGDWSVDLRCVGIKTCDRVVQPLCSDGEKAGSGRLRQARRCFLARLGWWEWIGGGVGEERCTEGNVCEEEYFEVLFVDVDVYVR